MKIKIRFFTLLIAFTFSCKNEKSKATFIYPDTKDIHEIVTTVITKEKLPITKTEFKGDTLISDGRQVIIRPIHNPLCINLQKIIILPTDTSRHDINNIRPPHPAYSIEVSTFLMLSKINKVPFFTAVDSANFFFQNDTLKNFTLKDSLAKNYYTTNLAELKKIRTLKKHQSHFQLSIPIFSADNKKAYIEVVYNCYGLCGYRNGIYLQKLNGKWIIVHKRLVSIS